MQLVTELVCCTENGMESPMSSDDEDKRDSEVKDASPAAGAMIHPSGIY